MYFDLRKHIFLYYSIWGLGAFLIFVFPWLVPSRKQVASDSYTLGFNNTVALIGLVFTILLLSLLHLRAGERNSGIWRKQFSELFQPHRVDGKEYLIPIALASLQCLLMWWGFGMLTDMYYGEVSYPLNRTELVLMGQVPYRDFQWNYGAYFLYLPALFVWVSKHQLASDSAYLFSLLASTYIGLVAVYYVIAQLRTTFWQRVIVFLLVSSVFNLALGTNSVHLRFIVAYAFLFLLHNQSRKLANRSGSQFFICALAVFLTLVCFFISPECGVVFCIGLFFYGIVHARTGRKAFLWTALASPLSSVIVVGAFSSDYLQSIGSFSSGGSNFPIVPVAHILLFLFSLVLLVPPMVAEVWRAVGSQLNQTEIDKSAIALGLCAMMVVYSAGALGRCDVHHVLFNGLMVFIILLAMWTRLQRPYIYYVGTFVIFLNIQYQLVNVLFHLPWINYTLDSRKEGIRRVDRNFFLADFETKNPELRWLRQQLAPYKKIGSPLGVRDDADVVLKAGNFIVPEFYPMPDLEVRTPAELKRRLGEVESMPYVLVQTNMVEALIRPVNWNNYANSQSQFLSILFLFPYPYTVQRKPLRPDREIASYIKANFKPLKEIGIYTLWKNQKRS